MGNCTNSKSRNHSPKSQSPKNNSRRSSVSRCSDNTKITDKKERSHYIERENGINKEAAKKLITNKQDEKAKELSIKQIQDSISFSLISEVNELSTKFSQSFVCAARLKVNQPPEQKERVPMDLVCVIDDSGSMSGQKAQLVRKSLKYLLKIMNEDDRVCFISFDDNEKILTPFLRNNKENKVEFKRAIQNIVGRGSTNIQSGIEAGLWMIKNRKEKNPVTCLFLLSDGQDDKSNVDQRVQKLINSYGITDNFIVNTYGYGADHDTTQMRNMAESNKGGYYYIEDIKKVSEWFILSVSGLLSAVGDEMRIKIKQKNSDKSAIKVNQVYGGDQLWIKQDSEKGDFEIYLPHLSIGDSKFFVFDCNFDHTQFKLTDINRHLDIFEANFEVRAVKQETMIRKQSTLTFDFKEVAQNELKNNSGKDYYEELMVTQTRAKGGMKIKLANELNKKQQYSQAKILLEEYQKEMKADKNYMINNDGIKHFDEDLCDAIQKCAPAMYRQASFEKMEVVHCQRRNSIRHREDWNSDQNMNMSQFNNNEIQLSDDSCGSDNDDPQNNSQQFQQQQQYINTSVIQKRQNSARKISIPNKPQKLQLNRSFEDDKF